ncbi:hypothetical protein EVAR_17308_1 [Eumeta japonica]|uniref:Uncharacterized protein n=1 Tax=Eumeta variegata TaxID=151549 RepID=A0A4C1TT77_EUMVA|nr:hypothetical protein EVAR_17308_1 [Eumeta japonica]
MTKWVMSANWRKTILDVLYVDDTKRKKNDPFYGYQILRLDPMKAFERGAKAPTPLPEIIFTAGADPG